jgi:hypothetical protein
LLQTSYIGIAPLLFIKMNQKILLSASALSLKIKKPSSLGGRLGLVRMHEDLVAPLFPEAFVF